LDVDELIEVPLGDAGDPSAKHPLYCPCTSSTILGEDSVKRITSLGLASVMLLAVTPARSRAAAETWTETKSAHFVVWSNAGDRPTRSLLWQLEQIRFAVATLWPWARPDLAKPMLVLVAKNEQSMRALAPRYWEGKGGVRPDSVWVSGADRHYMAIRGDLQGEDALLLNPYTSAYFAYVHLIFTSSFDRDMPLWFSRGLAGVLSNTIVQGNEILLGPPIPWHLERLREGARLRLKELVAVTRTSKEYTQGDGLRRFDAQAWSLVHYLMFGHNAARQAGVNKFAALLSSGKDPEAAFAESFGRLEDLEKDFAGYIERELFSYRKFVLDQGTKREQFTSRALTPAESAAGRAAFHVGMNRPTEARALIDEARHSDPKSGNAYLAEALLLQRENKEAESNAAFVKAASLGSTSPHAYYRAALSMWGAAGTDDATLRQMDAYLARATELNPLFAASYAGLAEVRAALKQPPDGVVALLNKAVSLDVSDPWIRISAARSLWRLGKVDEARRVWISGNRT
jgi:tetratricopeptide (TPR) repeat protein